MLQYIHLNHYSFQNVNDTYCSLHNQFSSAQIDSYNVVDDDTTNPAETSTMAAGNIVANYFRKF